MPQAPQDWFARNAPTGGRAGGAGPAGGGATPAGGRGGGAGAPVVPTRPEPPVVAAEEDVARPSDPRILRLLDQVQPDLDRQLREADREWANPTDPLITRYLGAVPPDQRTPGAMALTEIERRENRPPWQAGLAPSGGVVGGAVTGARIGGPWGAVPGAIVGGMVGKGAELGVNAAEGLPGSSSVIGDIAAAGGREGLFAAVPGVTSRLPGRGKAIEMWQNAAGRPGVEGPQIATDILERGMGTLNRGNVNRYLDEAQRVRPTETNVRRRGAASLPPNRLYPQGLDALNEGFARAQNMQIGSGSKTGVISRAVFAPVARSYAAQKLYNVAPSLDQLGTSGIGAMLRAYMLSRYAPPEAPPDDR